jgi:hypothetical protein
MKEYAKIIACIIVALAFGIVGTSFYFNGRLRLGDAELRASRALDAEYLEILGRANAKIDSATIGLRAIKQGLGDCQIIVSSSTGELRSAAETLRKVIADRKEFRARLDALQNDCNNYLKLLSDNPRI